MLNINKLFYSFFFLKFDNNKIYMHTARLTQTLRFFIKLARQFTELLETHREGKEKRILDLLEKFVTLLFWSHVRWQQKSLGLFQNNPCTAYGLG